MGKAEEVDLIFFHNYQSGVGGGGGGVGVEGRQAIAEPQPQHSCSYIPVPLHANCKNNSSEIELIRKLGLGIIPDHHFGVGKLWGLSPAH